MTVRFHFLDAYKEVPARISNPIRAELDDALATILALLPLDRVDIVVAPGPWVIPEYGLTGLSHGKARVTITIDLNSRRLYDQERSSRILGLLAHELHHIARSRGPGYGKTLGEALVSEGLAQCFEVEAGATVPFYAVALDAEALKRIDERAREQVSASRYDHNSWFFGRPDDINWPRNAGYSLAFTLVEAWLERNETSALASVVIPAEAILTSWAKGDIGLINSRAND